MVALLGAGASPRKDTMKKTFNPLFLLLALGACDATEEAQRLAQDDMQLPDEVLAGAAADVDAGAAMFEDRTIDLKGDWEGASSCVIWRSGGIVQCFGTPAEAESLVNEVVDAVSTTSRPSDLTAGPHPTAACSRSCLHIYEHTNFGGRDLHFCDRGYWQNLTSYGFNDELSSYKTGVHSVHLATNTGGNGAWYPGNTGVCVAAGGMSSGWNDRISSIYIK